MDEELLELYNITIVSLSVQLNPEQLLRNNRLLTIIVMLIVCIIYKVIRNCVNLMPNTLSKLSQAKVWMHGIIKE